MIIGVLAAVLWGFTFGAVTTADNPNQAKYINEHILQKSVDKSDTTK